MDKILKRNYKIISLIILAFCIYFFILPFLAPLMEKIAPNLWTCPFLNVTGKPCPICGITRDIGNIYKLDMNYVGLISLVLFMLVILETAARVIIITFISSLRKKSLINIIRIDVVYHTLLVIMASVYVIMFLVNNFWGGSIWH